MRTHQNIRKVEKPCARTATFCKGLTNALLLSTLFWTTAILLLKNLLMGG